MTIREKYEELEANILHPLAALSSEAVRNRIMEKCEYRTDYQRDIDRIVYSKSFKRLAGKTQVFIRPKGDHFRTRMTHTHEVSRIARVIARAIKLNEDLTEAIALAHDIGHTPFGHAGERALKTCYSMNFDHYNFGLIVVDKLENDGLNLTNEVRDGILLHSMTAKRVPYTLEGQIVRLADKIAYVTHDIEDIIRAGNLTESDLPKEAFQRLGYGVDKFIDKMVGSTIKCSVKNMEKIYKDGYERPTPSNRELVILMGDEEFEALKIIRNYLEKNIYTGLREKLDEEAKADRLIKDLFNYYTNSVQLLPEKMISCLDEYNISDVAAFYIAGMTDRFAEEEYEKIKL